MRPPSGQSADRRHPGSGASGSRSSGPREPRARVWAVGLGLLLVGTLGAYVLGRLAAHTLLFPARLAQPDVEQAPDLVGRELGDARREAEGAAVGLDVLGHAYAADADSGEILFQYPPPGLPLEPGKPIEVLVSAGRGTRRVPDLSGLPESTALAVLGQVGVRATRVEAVPEPGAEKGTVVYSKPPAGSPLGAEDSVVVAIARGGDVIEVPDLLGKTAEEAATILEGAQLVVGERSLAGEGTEEAPGELVVVGQDPPAGGLAASGSAVDLELRRSGVARDEE